MRRSRRGMLDRGGSLAKRLACVKGNSGALSGFFAANVRPSVVRPQDGQSGACRQSVGRISTPTGKKWGRPLSTFDRP